MFVLINENIPKRSVNLLRQAGFSNPIYESDRRDNHFKMIFPLKSFTPHDTPHDTNVLLIEFCLSPKSRPEMMNFLELNDRKHFRERYLIPLLSKGLIEMTIPEKPKDKNQKYLTTDKGKKVLESKI